MPFGYVLGGLTAGTAGALAVGGAAALAALYLLRRRRMRVPVAFAPLWFAGGGERRVERLARRLRRLLSLALQVAIFGCVVLAAADPRPAAEASARGRNIVLLVDRSASMGARDEAEGATRLDRARSLAREVIGGLGAGDRALVASFASGVTAATGWDDDRARLAAAVAGIAASEEPGDLPAALEFATSVLRGRTHPTLVLISDGGGAAPASSAPPTSAPLSAAPASAAPPSAIDIRFLPVGRRRDNLAIVAFSARRLPADPSSVEVALAVQSFRDRPTDVTLAVTAGPARIPIARRRLHLPPGARVAELLADVAAPDPRLEAAIEGAADDLPLDDRAYAVIPERPRLRVVVAGPRDLYLDGALLGLGSAVRIERATADAAARAPADAVDVVDGVDVVIFDGALPATVPETGRFLFIDPHGPASPWPDRGTVRAPLVSDVARAHPLLEHVSLADLNVGAARRLALGAGDVAVARALATPLLIARVRPGLRAVALAFDVRRSDLPLRGAFPLLVANALTWLADRQSAEALAFPTGRTVRVTLPRGEGPTTGDAVAEVRAADGTTTRAPVIAGAVSLPLPRAGFYDVARTRGGAADPPTRIAANLASTVESDTAPEPRPRIGDRTPPRPDPPRPPPRRPLWQLAAAAALGLLLLEWITFHRRLTV